MKKDNYPVYKEIITILAGAGSVLVVAALGVVEWSGVSRFALAQIFCTVALGLVAALLALRTQSIFLGGASRDTVKTDFEIYNTWVAINERLAKPVAEIDKIITVFNNSAYASVSTRQELAEKVTNGCWENIVKEGTNDLHPLTNPLREEIKTMTSLCKSVDWYLGYHAPSIAKKISAVNDSMEPLITEIEAAITENQKINDKGRLLGIKGLKYVGREIKDLKKEFDSYKDRIDEAYRSVTLKEIHEAS